MNIWIRRFRSLFAVAHAETPMAVDRPSQDGVRQTSAPPITDLDLLRAFGCDV